MNERETYVQQLLFQIQDLTFIGDALASVVSHDRPGNDLLRLWDEAKNVKRTEVCKNCGGLMIQTGTCMTCTQCGQTTGCGKS